ncbi:MAG: hypothetical protein AB7E28_06030, partial [Desulfurella sp.]
NNFDSLYDANKYLKDKLCEINSMHVYKRELTPKDGLINEQDFLNPLPSRFLQQLLPCSKKCKQILYGFF